jgi:chorismate mutase/prephenate dehydratase
MTDEIAQLRRKVDAVDDQILTALCERAKICTEIGAVKKKKSIPIKDAARETELFRRVKEKAVQLQLNPHQVEAVYREIVNICSAVQE